MKMTRVYRKLRLHQIALGLTVCLAATYGKLVAAQNSSLAQARENNGSSIANRWIPMTNSSLALANRSSDSVGERNERLDLEAIRECCARLLVDDDAIKSGDLLETASSVMAPIERLAPFARRPLNMLEDDDEQEDEPDEANLGQVVPQSRLGEQQRAEDYRWRAQNRPVTNHRPAEEQQLRASSRSSSSSSNNNNNNNNGAVDRGEPDIDPIAAEQEAAEASEAEAADRSALDEQLQQQQEIIRAQAQSEAKAIREQQEALLRQQQMQLRMSHRPDRKSGAPVASSQAFANNKYAARQIEAADQQFRRTLSDGGQARADLGSRMTADESQQRAAMSLASARMYHRPSINQLPQSPVDIQFSDQPDATSLAAPFSSTSMSQQQSSLSLAADQNAKPASLDADKTSSLAHPELLAEDVDPAKLSVNDDKGSDLHTAAQHHYGSHYGSVKGHHGDYYQFAESHKKGQFHSGFKRGGKKLQISGHASQHKSHAEGHVNWHGKKGKGVQYWDYKHKAKKQQGYYH